MKLLSVNKLLLSVFVFALSFCGYATDTAYKIDRTEKWYTVKYLLETENSTFIYCTYRVAQDDGLPSLANVKPSIHIMSDELAYKLLNTFNIPVSDETKEEYAFFTYSGQTLNFILEFERFPLDVPFDIIEDESDDKMFNISSITVNPDIFEAVDSKLFLDETPYTRFGMYIKEDHPVEYYSGEDYLLAVQGSDLYNTDTNIYRSFFISVTNSSNRTFEISGDSVKAVGYKPVGKREKEIKLKVLSKDECDKAWFEVDKTSVREKLGPTPTQELGESMMRIGIDANLPGLGFLGTVGLGAILASSDHTDLTPYMKELNEARENGIKEYIQPRTINQGETYSCFVSFKIDPKQTRTEVCIALDSQDFKFIM